MKKSVAGSLGLICVAISSSLFAFTCEDMLGIWKGRLSPLSAVTLSIHRPDMVEDAMISFTDANNVHIEYGMLHGACQAQADGSVFINLSRNAYGVNASLTATLNDKQQLVVTSFSYGDNLSSGNGRGFLHK